MKALSAILFLGRLGSFCVRHSLAFVITVAAVCVTWTVVYFGLLILAILTNSGLGGPLCYPAGLIVFLFATAAAGAFLLFPASAIAELVSRCGRLPILVQVPLCLTALAVLCPAAALYLTSLDAQTSVRDVCVGGGILFLALLLPMGLYWWTAQSVPLVLSLLGSVRHITRLLPLPGRNALLPARTR